MSNNTESRTLSVLGNVRFQRKRSPIFIIGILQRSGTNYLNNLLLLHPDVRSPGAVWEDFYLASAEHLQTYVTEMQRRWNPKWLDKLDTMLGPEAVLHHLGGGLVKLMENQFQSMVESGAQTVPNRPVWVVTATPNTRNLDKFFQLFPDATPIIIVRDGQATVESGVRSFGWDYEEAMRTWAESARRILQFCQQRENSDRYILVKYEDLHLHPEEEMRRIITVLGLDASVFDFEACKNLGLMGSSELKSGPSAEIHWKFVDKPKAFNPLTRAGHWPVALQRRFYYLAGAVTRELGYTSATNETPDGQGQFRNRILDVIYSLEIKLSQRGPAICGLLKKFRYLLLGVKDSTKQA